MIAIAFLFLSDPSPWNTLFFISFVVKFRIYMMQAIKAVKVPCGVPCARRSSRFAAMKAVRLFLPIRCCSPVSVTYVVIIMRTLENNALCAAKTGQIRGPTGERLLLHELD